MASCVTALTSVCSIALLLFVCLVTPAASRSLKSRSGRSMSVSKRIIGGYPVQKGDSPFLVSLQLVNVANRTTEHFCGASVIMGRFLLTAAHCVTWTRENPEKIKAFLGTTRSGSQRNHDNHSHVEDSDEYRNNASSVIQKLLNGEKVYQYDYAESETVTVQRRSDSEYSNSSSDSTLDTEMEYEACIEKIIVHEDYNDTTLLNDVAVLVMAMAIPEKFRTNVEPISLPTSAMERDGYPAAGIECTAYGWGRSHAAVTYDEYVNDDIVEASAKKINIEVRNDTVCGNFYKYSFSYEYQYDSNRMFCAGNIGNGYGGVYKGDSGGPVICGYAGKYYQAGIVSGGSLSLGAYVPAFYARVTAYEDWIKNAMANNL